MLRTPKSRNIPLRRDFTLVHLLKSIVLFILFIFSIYFRLKIDRDFFETHHTDLITPVVVTSKGLNIEFTNKEEVTIKDVVMMINR